MAPAAVLETSSLPPDCLGLEVTEFVLFHDHPNARKYFRRRPRELGVKIVLDDFGTSLWGPLSYFCLCRFQLDKLKIDRFFVRDFGTLITLLRRRLGRSSNRRVRQGT